MKIQVIIFLFLLTGLSSYGPAEAQKSPKKITVSGRAVDQMNSGVANAFVTIDGEKTNYKTNTRGYYKVKVKPDNTRIGIFTYSNGTVEEAINGRTTVNFEFTGSVPDQNRFEPDPGDEVVNVGYGRMKKKDLTTSVSRIDGTQSRYASYRTIYDMIRGELPGVQVNGTRIQIRGVSSITLTSDPLFVVDGIPVTSVDYIQPQTVKSIEVLKGSAATIYGSRGANGVILISLMNGKDK